MKKIKTRMIISDFFRMIRTNTELNKEIEAPKTIVITSANSREGKSFVCSNLALSYVQSNRKVLIIDTDIKGGIQSKIFRMDNTLGFSDFLMQKSEDNIEQYIKHTNIENLDIITSGKFITNPLDIMSKSKIEVLVKKLENTYDIILFDGISSLIINDAVVLSSVVDSTIIVVDYGKTKSDELEKTKQNLINVGGKISGVVINQMPRYTQEYKEIEKYKISEYNKLSNKVILQEKAKKILQQNHETMEKVEQ